MRPTVVPIALLAAVLMALPAAAERKKPQRAPSASGPIACTRGSCQSIPAGCHPEPGYLPDGMPSGYDVVVCPGRR